jgi:hypothetical protein
LTDPKQRNVVGAGEAARMKVRILIALWGRAIVTRRLPNPIIVFWSSSL